MPTVQPDLLPGSVPPPREGDLVDYNSPDWGWVRGRVIGIVSRTEVLCQDLSTHGGREYWPLAELRRVAR